LPSVEAAEEVHYDEETTAATAYVAMPKARSVKISIPFDLRWKLYYPQVLTLS
jgi:hypothetical protein